MSHNKRKTATVFVQFGFIAVFFLITMASATASFIDKGCSDDYSRLDVKIDEKGIECGSVYPLDMFGGGSVPEIQSSTASESQKYTVVMIDPDAPSRAAPSMRSWLHYLAVNVEGKNIKNFVSLSELSPSVDYNPPTPPRGSGPHRYIIYVMQQSGSVNPGTISRRGGFNIDDFVVEHSLRPVASNMFKTEHK